MSALDPAATRRLRGALGLLQSDKDGERLAAVDAVVRILGNAGMTVDDLVPNASSSTDLPPQSPWMPRRREHEVKLLRDHQRQAWLLQVSGFAWNKWERDFLESIRNWTSPLSAKQADRLRDLDSAVAAWRKTRGAA